VAEKKSEKLDRILKKLDEHDKKFDEIGGRFEAIGGKFEAMEGRFEAMEGRFDGKFNDVLTGQDKIIKELEAAREDRTFAIGKDREQDRRLNGLEERVQKVEVKVG